MGVSDQQNRLPRLHDAVHTATDSFTTEAEEAKFTGHITLGRIKGIRRNESDAFVDAARGCEQRVFGGWIATEVQLMRSQLSPRGATHETLAVAPLKSLGGA